MDLDEVLDTVDDPTGTALSMLIKTLGEGLEGNGENAADTVSGLAPSMTQADQLVTVLGEQTSTILRLIDALQPVVTAVGANRGVDAREEGVARSSR